MENIEYWKELSKVLIPVLAVIIAGLFALFNLSHSIKLQAKNKWKEDFRLHVSDYLESVMNFYYYSQEVKKNLQNENIDKDIQEKQSLFASEVLARFNRITFLTDYSDSECIKLNKIFQNQHSKINDILRGDNSELDIPKSLGDFFTMLKESMTVKNKF